MITDEDKHREAVREVSLRHGVYARRVAAGLMRQADADRQLAIMRAIAEDYRRKIQLSLDLGDSKQADA